MSVSLLSSPLIKKYRDALTHLVFPKLCLLCNEPLITHEQGICKSCINKLPYTLFENVPDNAVEQLFWGKVKIERAMALLNYRKGERPQKILHYIKYRNATDIGIQMGQILGERLKKSGMLNDIDAIVAVPLHPRRLRKRGYNQSDLIAKGISDISGIQCLSKSIERETNNDTQTRKSRFDRHLNVQRVFKISDSKILENKHILLIDDVVTTGSTLEACIQHISQIPGTKVSVAALAVACDY